MNLSKAFLSLLPLCFLLGCNETVPISFEAINPGEKISVQFSSSGCFHHKEFQLWFEGTSTGEVNLKTDASADHGRAPVLLHSSDLKSLNHLLALYRSVREGRCTTEETITVTKYAAGQAVSEEKYLNKTCGLGDRFVTPTTRVRGPSFEHYWKMVDRSGPEKSDRVTRDLSASMGGVSRQ